MRNSRKERLDVVLVKRGLVETRQKAQALVLSGSVLSGDRLLEKPGMKVDEDISLRLRREPNRYVSRGAFKLKAALDAFGIELAAKGCLDVGASTGGFTQVCLEAGASRVYALDVGHNQLHWKIRNDPRVVAMEHVNIRTAGPDVLPERVDFACIDTSFISLKLVLPAVIPLLANGGEIVALIKPQHEVGPDQVGKGGIVRDEKLHRRVVDEISGFAQSLGLIRRGLVESPIKGTTGNREFLIHLRKEK